MEELIKVSTSIHTIGLKILEFKDDWVTLPDDYKQQVDSIDSKLASYREHARLHGLDADSRMMEILKRAEDSLKRAESRLEGLSGSASSNLCCSHIRLWCAKLSILLFPEQVGKIVKKGNEDINDFLQALTGEAQIAIQMQLADRRRAIRTLSYDTDNLYVPIEKVESAVIKAIEDSKGRHIVLLYGGVGKGKSTLSRYIVHLYGNTEDQEKRKLFEHVIWVSCSNCSEKDVSTKQLEILQQYSPNTLGESPPKDTSREARIAQALKDFLRARRVLIILDDVSNPSFLRGMWKATVDAQAIRYLVTSQLWNICNKAGLKQYSLPPIFMEDATQDEALGILASHVGLEFIPTRLQAIAKEIVLAVDKNPLALACLASHFANSGDNTEERAWQDASTELHKLLYNTEDKIVLDSTPRNLWAAMKLSINTLETVDAKKILFMIYECKAESVPEAVLRIWHSKISKCTFFQSSEELRMRELLKPTINSNNGGQNYRVSKAWSVGSLVKYYIEEYMVDEIGPVIRELVGDKELGPKLSTLDEKQVSEPQAAKIEKARVALMLCALYFDQSHFSTYETVTQALIQAKIAYSHESLDHLRREAVEPIIWLLDKPTEEHWKEADVCSVRKVFLSYICKSELDDENVSQLLRLERCTVAQLATLEAIRQICYIEEKPLFHAENLNFVQAIVRLIDLTTGLPSNVQESASRALMAICWKVGDQMSKSKSEKAPLGTLIIDLPGVLYGLGSAFASPNQQSDAVVGNLAAVFSNLAHIEGFEGSPAAAHIRTRILNEKGVLEGLVKCLYEHKKPGLQKVATSAIANLAWFNETLKLQVANQDGALEGLVTLLSAHDKAGVQELATRAIKSLAATSDNSLKFQVANQDGALEGLVMLLSAHDKPGVQELATRAIKSLAATSDNSLKFQVANQDGALEGLVMLLSAHDKPGVQEQATRAILNLAATSDNSLKFQVANQDGALEGLVMLLSAHDKPGVQELATRAIKNLAATSDNSLKLQVANQDGALEGLVTLFSARDKPGVQEAAARALANLADTGDNARNFEEGKALLSETDSLLEGLSSLLENGVLPSVQYWGACALTFINPTRGKGASLTSGEAYKGRAHAFIHMGMYVEALVDLDQAVNLLNGMDQTALSRRIFVKAKLGDFEGALDNANEAVSNSDRKPYALQERGVLKRILGDLEGALADLDEGLKLKTDDYERLKHRGYVKFLLKDEEGARADAEWALRIKPPRVDWYDYGRDACLGTDPAEYLGYKLK